MRKEMIASCLFTTISILVMVGMAVAVLFLCSCRTIREVPVEKVVEKTQYVDKTKIDSIYQHDSIYIKATGDTIYEYRDKYIYKYEFIHDTLFISKIDSIPYTIEVERSLSNYEQLQMCVGKVGIPILILLFFFSLGWIIKKIV